MVHRVFKGEMDTFLSTKSGLCAEMGRKLKHYVLSWGLCGQRKIYGIPPTGEGD